MTGKKWYLLGLLFAIQSSSGIFCKQDYEQTRTNEQYKDAPFLKEENLSSSRRGPMIPLKQVAPQEELSLGREIGGKTRNKISSSSTYTVPKIVGGKEVPAGEYPWYSALYRNKNGSETNLDFYCGGMLISSRFVLSAAHCKPNVGDVVVVGALCPYETGNCNQQVEVGYVESLFQDPRYTMEITSSLGWDYVLIQLTEPITTIASVALDSGTVSRNFQSGKILWVAGMGFTDPSNQIAASRLEEAELEYVPEDSCKDQLKPLLLGQFTICATDIGRVSDVCFGDSGGPLYDKENKVLVGLTSYGDSACSSRLPGVYARISDNFAWLRFTVCLQDPTDELCRKTVEPTTSPAPTSRWCDDAELKVTLATDSFPYENAWALTDLTSNTRVSVGSLSGFEQNAEHDGNFCLPVQNNECYRFDIDDAGGDGIDLNGSNMDFCLILDDEIVECNKNFAGDRDAIIFPKDNCYGACNMTSYVLTIQTGRVFFSEEVKTSIYIRDDRTGQLIFPYYFSGFQSNRNYTYPIDLCHGSYHVEIDDIGRTIVTILDMDGNVIWRNGELKMKGGVFTSVNSIYGLSLNSAGAIRATSLFVYVISSLAWLLIS